jgi:CRISP-associated protein Cas1
MPRDLHLLPKVRDSWSFVYIEHARLDQDDKAVVVTRADGRTALPVAALMVVMLGPGTSITHAAVRVLSESGCSILWTGEEGVRLYAQGLGETRKAGLLHRQARLWADPVAHARVVRRMYEMRFGVPLEHGLDLRQIRGREGLRVRAAYAEWSRRTGVPWHGRSYERGAWSHADPVNRALSAANACLYGVVHAAVLAVGASPALGFVHTGRQLSFVYDVADLYKTELTLPVAFETAAAGLDQVESRVRHSLRDRFAGGELLKRLVPDLQQLLEAAPDDTAATGDADTTTAAPGGLDDGAGSEVEGGINYGDEVEP